MSFSFLIVPSAGIEPAHLSILEFESSASTNSANWAIFGGANIKFFVLKQRNFYQKILKLYF